MFGSGMNLITLVIGFGMSSAFIVFICTRLICVRRRRFRSRLMFEVGYSIDLDQEEHRTAGLEPVLVAAIPTMKFEHEAFKKSMEDAQCSICLGEYQEKEVLRIMPKCNHTYHLSCIDVWLRKHSTCPVCRLHLRDSIETHDDQLLDYPETTIDHPQVVVEHPVIDERNEGQYEATHRNSLDAQVLDSVDTCNPETIVDHPQVVVEQPVMDESNEGQYEATHRNSLDAQLSDYSVTQIDHSSEQSEVVAEHHTIKESGKGRDLPEAGSSEQQGERKLQE